jgi:THO complex subunit 2
MKRLSKENIRAVGRQLARLSHGSPVPVFSHILNQIEAFDNLIPVVVEALRYSTDLSRDVLSNLFVLQLQKEGLKLKKGDTHYTLWFASLAKFISLFYSRYPDTEVRGLLHFLLSRLQRGQSLDLHVLQNLLGKMGRCETLLEMTAQQLEALAGGRVLRNEMMTAQAPPSGAVTKGALIITPDVSFFTLHAFYNVKVGKLVVLTFY